MRRVAETPHNKQKSNAVWRALEKRRRRSTTVALATTSVHVVGESPAKHGAECTRTPNTVRAHLAKRKSFYSEAVTRSEKLEARLCQQQQSQTILSPSWRDRNLMTSPRRVQTLRLFDPNAHSPEDYKPRLLLVSPEAPPPRTSLSQHPGSVTPTRPGRIHDLLSSPSSNTRSRLSRMTSPPAAPVVGQSPARTLRSSVKARLVFGSPEPASQSSLIPPPQTENRPPLLAARKVSFLQNLEAEESSRFAPCPSTQSPLKPILTPSKRTPRRAFDLSQLGSPVRSSPRIVGSPNGVKVVSFGLDCSSDEEERDTLETQRQSLLQSPRTKSPSRLSLKRKSRCGDDDAIKHSPQVKRHRRTSGCKQTTTTPSKSPKHSSLLRHDSGFRLLDELSVDGFNEVSPTVKNPLPVTSSEFESPTGNQRLQAEAASPVIAQLQRDVSGSGAAHRKYSPLSALGLKQLCESPLLVTSSRRRVNAGDDVTGKKKEEVGERVHRKAKRSLYK